MKRILASILAVSLLLVLCPAALAASGSAKSLAGYYELSRAYTDSDEVMSKDSIDLMRKLDLGVPNLDIKEKNTGTMDLLGNKYQLSFDLDKMEVFIGDEGTPFSLKDGVITITIGDTMYEFSPVDKPEGSSALDEDAADDAIYLSFGSARYNAGLWNVPVLEPEEEITGCTKFTLCYRYDSVDSSMLGEQRVYVCINLKNNAWLDCGRMNVAEEGKVGRTTITLSKPRNVEGIALLSTTPNESSYSCSAWIEDVR